MIVFIVWLTLVKIRYYDIILDIIIKRDPAPIRTENNRFRADYVTITPQDPVYDPTPIRTESRKFKACDVNPYTMGSYIQLSLNIKSFRDSDRIRTCGSIRPSV